MAAVSGMARITGSAENKFVSFDQHLEKEAISGRTIVFVEMDQLSLIIKQVI